MDFELSEEQRLLKDSVDGITADRYADLKTRAGYMAEPGGYSRAIWKEYADLGLLAIPFDEAARRPRSGRGGDDAGHGSVRPHARHRALSRHGRARRRHPAPCRHRGAENQADTRHGVRADAHSPSRIRKNRPASISPTSRPSAKADGKGGYTLEGEKCVALHGDSADWLIVSCARLGRSPLIGRDWPVPGGCQGSRLVAARLSHAGRPARGRRFACWCARECRRRDRRTGQEASPCSSVSCTKPLPHWRRRRSAP